MSANLGESRHQWRSVSIAALRKAALWLFVVCGATGEEYAEPFVNAIVCDTSDGRELATYLRALFEDENLSEELREHGAQTAARYTWAQALEALERKVAYVDAVAK